MCSGIIYTVPKYVGLGREYFMPDLVLIMSLRLKYTICCCDVGYPA